MAQTVTADIRIAQVQMPQSRKRAQPLETGVGHLRPIEVDAGHGVESVDTQPVDKPSRHSARTTARKCVLDWCVEIVKNLARDGLNRPRGLALLGSPIEPPAQPQRHHGEDD